MNYIEQYLGKKAQDLTYQDIVHYFQNEQVESDKLEFKSYNPNGSIEAKYDGLMECICAFLNSSGGLLIWGAPEGVNDTRDGKKIKIFKGALAPVDRFVEKDFIIGKITSLLTPAPNKVLFHTYEDNGKYVFLIEAAQSEYSPHQFKNIYYMRIDGATRPAPHHYIEALFNKVTYPKLEAFIEKPTSVNNGPHNSVIIKISIANMSKAKNEQGLNYRLELSGSFSEIRRANSNMLVEQNSDNYSVLFGTCKGTLFYSQPFNLIVTLIVPNNMALKADSHVLIRLFYGGKNAPLKNSQHRYNFFLNYGKIDFTLVENIDNVLNFDDTDIPK